MRRIQIPDYYAFYDLHVATQDAMGWLDSHLHDFKIQPRRRACLDIQIESPFALDDIEEAAPLLTNEVAVADFIQEPGGRALYTYDYGDDWRHDVLFEGASPKEPGKKYPVCLAGELEGPQRGRLVAPHGQFHDGPAECQDPGAARQSGAGLQIDLIILYLIVF